MRIGYLTVPPTMPDREALPRADLRGPARRRLPFPNALLQHAIEDLERLSIDVGALERRRDRLVGALRGLGYETTMPEGTFYVMARSPIEDDVAFGELLAEDERAGPAGHGRRAAGLVPDLADRERRDGRAGPGRLPARPRAGPRAGPRGDDCSLRPAVSPLVRLADQRTN